MESRKVYITFANAKRLTKSIQLENFQLDPKRLFEYIFDTDISSVLSVKDAQELFKLKMICEKKYSSHGFEIKKIETYESKFYIFENKSPPKYHSNPNCEFLRSDYKNFAIPKDIQDKSPEEKKKFIDFCNLHKNRIINKDASIINKINETFHLNIISLEELIINNSGVHEISKMSETDLHIFIYLSLSKCIDILRENINDKKIFEHYQYKTLEKNDLDKKDLKPQVLEYIKNKLHLIEGLRNLYYKENNETVEFEANLLVLAGFDKCKSCN